MARPGSRTWMRGLWVATVLIAGWAGCRRHAAPTVSVFAAASLADGLEALADSFARVQPETHVLLNLAATSLLARQIEQGAPADLFFSASTSWMETLEAQGLLAGPPRQPLTNRLVLVGPKGSAPLDSFRAILRFSRVALADPEQVPAGLYARQGLACLGLWEALRPQVVPTLDVRAALLAVAGGAADAAVVYASDALVVPDVQVIAAWPEACHPEIRYAVARLREAPNPDGADAFLAFVLDPQQQGVWERFGFIPVREN